MKYACENICHVFMYTIQYKYKQRIARFKRDGAISPIRRARAVLAAPFHRDGQQTLDLGSHCQSHTEQNKKHTTCSYSLDFWYSFGYVKFTEHTWNTMLVELWPTSDGQTRTLRREFDWDWYRFRSKTPVLTARKHIATQSTHPPSKNSPVTDGSGGGVLRAYTATHMSIWTE